MRKLGVGFAATALVGAAAVTVASSPAQAAAGACDSGKFCYFFNSNQAGSSAQYTSSVGNYGTGANCHKFTGAGAGKGRCLKNDAASVWNRTNKPVTVFFNSNYAGASQTIKAGAKANLNATLKNNNASHRIGAAPPPPAGVGKFWLPFPCKETWQAGTRMGHSPKDAVDFNHYPDDNGWKVFAAAPGTVTRVGNTGSTSYGKHIYISHPGGYETRYAHLSAQNVKQGQKVTAKTFIGRVGNTGGSTGPHLHYEQRRNGSVQRASFVDGNPVYYGQKNLARKSNCP